ncbi:MAG TPA: CHRD domain-containing protein [Gaiellaceae bacterium]|nr:CHRD domain-containing protein [Gaiellaceae bacterium]
MTFRRLALVLALGLAGALATASILSSAPVRGPFFAALTGAKEPGGGDSNGKGSFSATIQGQRLCYGITVGNIGRPNAAHIHRGRAGVAGPVVITLKHPTTGSPGASAACVTVGATLRGQIRANPSGFYVNVHNIAFPGGAVRGQLFIRG